LTKNANYVRKLKKALYGLKHAPREWYSRMDKYFQEEGFRKGSADKNLYIKVTQDSILFIEVYVDDIIFGRNADRLSHNLQRICIINLKCHYSENYPSFWVFRYVKPTK
jgi:hypothetical protein